MECSQDKSSGHRKELLRSSSGVQEHLTEQIATAISEALAPAEVTEVIEAVHMCMVMRGVQKMNTKTVTSVMRGMFQKDPQSREEFLSLTLGK